MARVNEARIGGQAVTVLGLSLFGAAGPKEQAHGLYVTAVKQARHPAFYRDLGVADTVDGRFDLLSLHVVLILRRLKQQRSRTAELSQALFDVMFADLDQNLRELGVGDMTIGKKIRGLAEAFYGRVAAYDTALAADNEALEGALARNVYRTTSPPAGVVAALTAYVRRQADRLDAVHLDDLLAGKISFGDPLASDEAGTP